MCVHVRRRFRRKSSTKAHVHLHLQTHLFRTHLPLFLTLSKICSTRLTDDSSRISNPPPHQTYQALCLFSPAQLPSTSGNRRWRVDTRKSNRGKRMLRNKPQRPSLKVGSSQLANHESTSSIHLTQLSTFLGSDQRAAAAKALHFICCICRVCSPLNSSSN